MPLSVNIDTLLILKPANSTISFPRSAWNARFDALRRVGDHSLEIATTDRDAERRNSRSHAERGNESFEFACLRLGQINREVRFALDVSRRDLAVTKRTRANHGKTQHDTNAKHVIHS